MDYHIELLQNISDLPDTVTTLCKAFKWQFAYPANDQSKDLVYACLECHVKAGFYDGQVYVAKSNQGNEIVGVAVWFGPGQRLLQNQEQEERCGWNAFQQRLSAQSRRWWSYFNETYNYQIDLILGPDVRLEGWHLQLLGVHPDYQRRGIATSLCELIEAKARSSGLLSVLDTADPALSEHVYQKAMGYELRGITEKIKDRDEVPSLIFHVLSKA
ncbi:hypothetical protein DL96DRAFT_1576777 [Flagelloscypha sp. PMI_526]|nr:hypothetical protein DL96DRAFT_1576777 [Flagelloscypha sp. PMI_526]